MEVAKQGSRSFCGIPERSYSWMLLRSIWTLFAVAVFAVVLRFIARSQKFGGVGFGREDWVALTCLAPLTLYDVLLDMGKFCGSQKLPFETHHRLGAREGLGKDIWTLRPSQIDSDIRVSLPLVRNTQCRA